MYKFTSAEHRILVGTIGFIISLLSFAMSGFSWYNPDATLGAATITVSSTLLAAGLVKKTNTKKLG